MKLVLIGGGEISKMELIKIDKEIINRRNRKDNLVLFFPTAADDSEGYSEQFKKYYSSLGCKKVETIKIFDNNFNIKNLRRLLSQAGIVYLGGGNTQLLIDSLKKYKIDNLLKEVVNNDVLIAGISAGAIALGDIANSNKNDGIIEALGIIPNYVIEAHFTEWNKENDLIKLLKRNKKGIGIDEKTAVFIEDHKAKVIGEGNVFLFNKEKMVLKEGDSFNL